MTAGGFLCRIAPALLAFLLLSVPAYAALRTNDNAPLFSLPLLEGGELDLAAALGKGRSRASGGVVLTFFATWCGPCRNELPLLNALAHELAERGISVVAVDLKEDPSDVRKFIAGLQADRLTVAVDRDGKTAALYQVRIMPTTFCIGADGRIKDMLYGEVRSADAFRKCAEKLFK